MENKELETWLLTVKEKNLSAKEIELEIHKAPFEISRILLDNGNNLAEKAEHLFNQWQKEAEFSPKRGDMVLVWNMFEKKAIERIFLADIKGSSYPIIVVGLGHENKFVNNEQFAATCFMHMKPLPTEQPKETDFKSQVIELIKGEINAWQNDFETSVKDEDFQSCSVNFIAKMACEKILNKIKQL